MPQIQLIGGEKDGQVIPIQAAAPRPDIYYAVPNIHDEKLRPLKGKARVKMEEQLAVLAYTYDRYVRKNGVGWEYRYIRCPERDKRLADQRT